MIQDLLDYPEFEIITPKIIQSEEMVTMKLESITDRLKQICNRLYKELHPEEYEHA
jgi:hypothetical protein